MKLITIITSLILLSCSTEKPDKMEPDNTLIGNKTIETPIDNISEIGDGTNPVTNEYQNKLLATKQAYPFDKWRAQYNKGLTQYTNENCHKIKKVFDDLISSLIANGSAATEEQKIQLFKIAILKANQLNEEIDGLIETGEREELCELTNKITEACGLEPSKYGGGEGLASEWREW